MHRWELRLWLAASGTVIAINDDEIYGHSVWVDHGNGYVTIYRNKGDTTVNVEDSVVQGTTLFVIGEDNADLGYQMQKDGSYIILWICWQSVVDCRKVWKIHVRKKECRYKNEHTDRCRSGVTGDFTLDGSARIDGKIGGNVTVNRQPDPGSRKHSHMEMYRLHLF